MKNQSPAELMFAILNPLISQIINIQTGDYIKIFWRYILFESLRTLDGWLLSFSILISKNSKLISPTPCEFFSQIKWVYRHLAQYRGWTFYYQTFLISDSEVEFTQSQYLEKHVKRGALITKIPTFYHTRYHPLTLYFSTRILSRKNANIRFD